MSPKTYWVYIDIHVDYDDMFQTDLGLRISKNILLLTMLELQSSASVVTTQCLSCIKRHKNTSEDGYK